ncbi:lipoprotein signal peptidase [Desulfolithobacter dissulfuricans]|uniref:Lipoprotein signal peptidase n=2 Tax=Desulfolithobacter dissulfuricans TaxID=2795293 RepID=A0A915XKH1_9BACT|nr:lipoprotein signal peptidase [Desulfolithobacter dissulfuricans]
MRLFGIMALVLVLDQAVKSWIVHHFSLYESVVVIPGLFNLTFLTNTGAAFGMLAGQPSRERQLFFVGVALVALAAIVVMHRRLADQSRWFTVALGLIGGGALGNLVDRVRYGAVVDFLDFYFRGHHWPAFNVADSAITVGVGLFLVTSFVVEKNRKKFPG